MSNRSRIDIERHISAGRFATYLNACNGSRDAAFDLYVWNAAVSGALIESIGLLEVALRNAMHDQMTLWCAPSGQEWYDDPNGVFNPQTLSTIMRARRRLASRGAPETAGRIVAELTFDFWRFLLTGGYQANLWVPCLRHAFHKVKRERLEARVEQIYVLRNRVAHHEAIFTRDLVSDYDVLLEIAELIGPRLAWWIDIQSRVLSVVSERP